MTKQIATVVSLPRNDKFCYEPCTAKRSNLIKKCAFTLAEVLITLGIIGVVAAITMPILVGHYNKQAWVNQLKKTVSTLENGFKLAMAEDGVDKLSETTLWQSAGTTCTGGVDSSACDNFYTNFQKYFNVTYSKSTTPRLFGNLSNPSNTAYGIKMQINFPSSAQIQLNALKQTPFGGTFGPHLSIVDIVIDVNGIKNPNVMGRDVFLFGVTEYGQVIPYGSDAANNAFCSRSSNKTLSSCGNDFGSWNWDTSSSIGCIPNALGYFCAARIMAEGWKMNY